MKNIIPIVFCFDRRIILGASVVIESLIDNTTMLCFAGKPVCLWGMNTSDKDCQENIDKLPKKLKKLTFRDLRKGMFSKV